MSADKSTVKGKSNAGLVYLYQQDENGKYIEMLIVKMAEPKASQKFGYYTSAKSLLDETNVYVPVANRDLYFYPHGLNVKATVGESCGV